MKQKVALVLSGGGARGIAHIGVIEELEQRGFEISSIAGTSMGALVGGIYASGGLEIFADWLTTLNKFTVFSLMDFTLSKNGIVKGNRVLNEIKQMVPDKNIEECNIPFSAVAADIITRKEVVFETGSLYNAIRASISIPSLFKPYKINGMTLIDGGVVNQLPLDRVKRTSGDIMVAVNVGANIPSNPVPKPKPLDPPTKLNEYEQNILNKLKKLSPHPFSEGKEKDEVNYYNLLTESTSMMIQKIVDLSIKINEPDILIEIPIDSYSTLEFYKADEISKLGKEATRVALSKFTAT